MIALDRIRQRRIERADARATAFGAATVAAQHAGDPVTAARFMSQMHAAQAARDGLLAARPVQWVRPFTWGVAIPAFLALFWGSLIFLTT